MEHNKISGEFGKKPQESKSVYESLSQREIKPEIENPLIDEENANKPNKKRRKNKLQRVVSTFMATIATAVFAVTTFPEIQQTFIPSLSVSINLNELGINEYGLFYHIEADSESELTLTLYNDFENYKTKLISGENSGLFEDLTPGMEYTFAVISDSILGKRTHLSRKVIVPHPVTFATVNFDECGVGDVMVYYSIAVNSQSPLKIILEDGTNTIEKDLEVLDDFGNKSTSGRATGEIFVDTAGKNFTLKIVGTALYGKTHVVATINL